MDIKEVKWLFFDVGFTLVSEDKAVEIRAKEQCELDETKSKGLTPSKIIEEMYRVSTEFKPQYKAVMKEYGITNVIPYNPSYEEIYKDTFKVLDYLKGKYHLGIIANQEKGLEERLIKMDLAKYFEIRLGSHDVGLHKPDHEFFKLAMSLAHAKPEECCMIGDRLDNDIFPAKELGMKAIRLRQGYAKYQETNNEALKPDYDLPSIGDLIKIL